MVNLALNYQKGPLSIKEICAKEKISVFYLEQLFLNLRRQGLVKSLRGAKGGYELASSPGEITVADIMKAVEGRMAPVNCILPDGEESFRECSLSSHCYSQILWRDLWNNTMDYLAGVSLADVIQRGDRELKRRTLESELVASPGVKHGRPTDT